MLVPEKVGHPSKLSVVLKRGPVSDAAGAAADLDEDEDHDDGDDDDDPVAPFQQSSLRVLLCFATLAQLFVSC